MNASDLNYWEKAAKENHMQAVASHEDPIRWFASGFADALKAASYFKNPKQANIMDFGCGSGRVTKPMSSIFRLVFAVDWSTEMIRRINDMKLHNVRTSTIPFLAMTNLNAIFSHSCFMHFKKEDLAAKLFELTACLPSGGQLIFQLPCYEQGCDRDTRANSLAIWTRAELEALLDSLGYRGINVFQSPGGFDCCNLGIYHNALHNATKA